MCCRRSGSNALVKSQLLRAMNSNQVTSSNLFESCILSQARGGFCTHPIRSTDSNQHHNYIKPLCSQHVIVVSFLHSTLHHRFVRLLTSAAEILVAQVLVFTSEMLIAVFMGRARGIQYLKNFTKEEAVIQGSSYRLVAFENLKSHFELSRCRNDKILRTKPYASN